MNQAAANSTGSMEQSGFLTQDEGGYPAMTFGRPRVLANLELVAGELNP